MQTENTDTRMLSRDSCRLITNEIMYLKTMFRKHVVLQAMQCISEDLKSGRKRGIALREIARKLGLAEAIRMHPLYRMAGFDLFEMMSGIVGAEKANQILDETMVETAKANTENGWLRENVLNTTTH